MPSLPSNSVVVGDLNFDLNHKNVNDCLSLNYLRIKSSNGFFNIVDTPTRFGIHKNSLLDHIFVNNLKNSMLSCTIDNDVLADHLPVAGLINFDQLSDINKQNKLQKISITKLDRGMLAEKFAEP